MADQATQRPWQLVVAVVLIAIAPWIGATIAAVLGMRYTGSVWCLAVFVAPLCMTWSASWGDDKKSQKSED